MDTDKMASEGYKNENVMSKEGSEMKKEDGKVKIDGFKSYMINEIMTKKEGDDEFKMDNEVEYQNKMKSELSSEKSGLIGDIGNLSMDFDHIKDSLELSDNSEENGQKTDQMYTSEGSIEGDSVENEERRSRRTAAINQRLLMKKITSHEPNIDVTDDSPEVKKRKKMEKKIKSNYGSMSDEIVIAKAFDILNSLDSDVNYEPASRYENEEETYAEYVNKEYIPQEVLDNPGEIYNFNEHEVKRKVKKVLVNKNHIFIQGLKYIDDYIEKNIQLKYNDNESLRKMGLKNIEIEQEYFIKLGGYYEDLKDEVDEINNKIEKLNENLNELYLKMGKTQITKQNEPPVICSYINNIKEIKDKALEYEEILQEMKDFQDLVNDEHKEKRKLFKNLIIGTSRQMIKVEQDLQKNDQERIKQIMVIYKGVSSTIDLFWKKIEKFAWEHLKKDLQQELIKKKKQNLDKFIQDAIKVSINDQERYIFDKKVKGSHSDNNRGAMESESDEDGVDEDRKGDRSDESRKVNDGKVDERKSGMSKAMMANKSKEGDSGMRSNIKSSAGEKVGVDEEEVEDEYVFDKDEEKMELDDLKLEDEMDSDKEENELNNLQKDLEMPLEELLKMYRQSGEEEDNDDIDQMTESDNLDEEEEEYNQGISDVSHDISEVSEDSSKSSPKRRESTSSNREDMVGSELQLSRRRGRPRKVGFSSESSPTKGATSSDHGGSSRSSGKEGSGGSTQDKEGTAAGAVKIPFLIKAVLRPYQKEGLGWLVSLYERGINGILADEMGLGKTLQTISLLAYLACYKGNWGPHIIIVPTSILLNWVMEFNRFCPGFKVLAYYGTPAERARKRSGWNKQYGFNVLVSSYAIVVQDAMVLKRKAWEYMILDEAQNIKNFHSKRWQTLLTFNTKYRLLLTGTPLQNSLQELWSLMHFILPNIFTSHTQFNIWFTDPLNQALDNLYSSNPLYKNEIDVDNKEKEEMNRNNMELVEKLHVIFRPYLLRRLKKDVEKQMPSKYEHVLKCTLTKRQQVLYDEFISLYNLNGKGLDKEKLSYRSMLNILMQLRKICNHPDQLKSRDVQIPIEFNIEPLQLPSMFKIIEKGSIYNRREKENKLDSNDENDDSSGTVLKDGNSVVSVNSGVVPRVKVESAKNYITNTYSQFTGRNIYANNYMSRSSRVRSDSIYLRSRASPTDDASHDVKTPPSRSTITGGMNSLITSTDTASSDMISTINSSVEGSVASGQVTGANSPTRMAERSPQIRSNHTRSTETSPTRSPNNQKSDSKESLGSMGEVDGLCMESYNRRRDRLILDKKIKRRKLDLNFNSECLIQYSSVSEGNLIDFGEDLTNCGYSFNYGKTYSNGMMNLHATISKLTNTCLMGNTSNTAHTKNDRTRTGLTKINTEEKLYEVFDLDLKNKLEMNKVIESYYPLVMNFLVIASKVVSRPIKLFYSGESGVNHNNRNAWHMKEVATKMFKRDDKEYYTKNSITLEGINSQYKLLFPSKRSLNDDCGKFRVLGPLLLRLKSEGHRCIIYTQFSKMLDILENWINFMGFTYTRLDGSTKIDMRQKIVNRFNENTKIFLFISSTRSGGVGITLTGADTVIFYDTDWNPAIDRQAMDRCHRIGQTKDVNVYRLISEHTVEENIWRKQLQKRKLDDLIVDQGQFDIQHNTWFSNIDTLINIFQSKKEDDDEDIYGKTILHESNVGDNMYEGTGVKSLKMLIEVEDADDSMALKKLTKENEKINKEDFENDMINTIPGLVTYCIKFLLKYQTSQLEKQVETMKLKIQVEDYQNKQDDEEEDDEDIYTDYSSNEEANEGSNEEEEDEYESDE